ncbi:MAG: D-sedoheptulose 7-phosphate isomerase [Deltaproteobacteria bacterium]|nr:D-sedoheptulose 7-phosphate isomerase [Deltaproteobacteria bacterium]
MEGKVLAIFEESAELKKSFAEKNVNAIVDMAVSIAHAFKNGNKLLLFGNGGSAADAQHLAAEFVNRFRIERPPLPAIALTTDSSIITSIGNDYDFSEIFSKQVKALAGKGDIAIGISTSGNSPNVLKGLEAARATGVKTVAFTGKNGGKIAEAVDVLLNVESEATARIQEVHITIGHAICDLVDQIIFGVK